MDENTKKIIESIKSMKQPEYFTAIMHPSHRIPTNKDGIDIQFGMDVQYSPFVETGEVYLISNKSRQPMSFPPLDNSIMAELSERMEKLIYSTFGVPSHLFGKDAAKPYDWKRGADESLLDWGDRLFDRGLLDNPVIRWEYQKAVLGLPFTILKTIWLKLNDED